MMTLCCFHYEPIKTRQPWIPGKKRRRRKKSTCSSVRLERGARLDSVCIFCSLSCTRLTVKQLDLWDQLGKREVFKSNNTKVHNKSFTFQCFFVLNLHYEGFTNKCQCGMMGDEAPGWNILHHNAQKSMKRGRQAGISQGTLVRRLHAFFLPKNNNN